MCRLARVTFAGLISLSMVVGCAPTGHPDVPAASATPRQVAPDVNADPCALRMHDDLARAFLLYYAINYRMPAALVELQKLPGFADLKFTCPLSGKVYGYLPDGIPGIDGKGRIILFDTTPAHGGFHWAIEMTVSPATNQPFANVIPIPDAQFKELFAAYQQ